MKNLFKFKFLLMVLAMFVAFGAVDVIDTSAQRRKPVIRKKVYKKPVIKLYTVASGQKMRVRLNDNLSSKTNRVGDTFTANVTEPVYSTTGVLVIPAGSTLTGRVSSIQAAQKGGKPGTIDVNFYNLKTPNGTSRAINGTLTELDTKNAKSDSEGTASGDKMKHRKLIFIGGGGVGGAILGGLIGGGKGAIIGGLLGAGGGFLGDKMTKGEEAEVRSGTEFGVYLNQAISLPKFVEMQ